MIYQRVALIGLGLIASSMAHAMRLGLEAGYWAHRSGRIPRKLYASASSPQEGVIGE